MSRIGNLLTSSDPVPTEVDAEFQLYNVVEQRLIVKCGGSKEKLMKLYRRVKGRGAFFAAAKHGWTVLEVSGSSSTCPPEETGASYVSDLPRLSGYFGTAIKILGNEMFVGETGAVHQTFQDGEVHLFTRADDQSPWVYDSSEGASTPSNGGEFGASVDYDGTRMVAGETNNGASSACDVFTVTSGVMAFEQSVVPNTYTLTAGRSGRAVAINDTHLLFSVPNQNITENQQGGVEYWTRSGTVWTFQQAFTMGGTPLLGAQFGGGMVMTDSSTAFIAYCDTSDSNTLTIQKFTRSGSTWTYDSEFAIAGYPNASTNYAVLGTDGTNIIAGQDGYDIGTNTNEGYVVVFDLTGNVTSEIIGDADDAIGSGVSIDGATAMVGYAFDDTETTNSGIIREWDVCI